jgi:hypothetical protein
MSTNQKLKTIELDERGRITLPKSMRKGVESFAIKPLKDGILQLIPQKSVSIRDAELLKVLKRSISEYKDGKTKKIPKNWIE